MASLTASLIGGIDAGGTTFKCGVRDADGAWVARQRVPTTSPAETVAACARFFREAAGDGGLAALGVGSFGPLDLDPDSGTFGALLATPKPGWSGFAIRDAFAKALGCKVALDTDVNAALLAEMASGAAKGADTCAYVTVGTGIGAGLAVAGRVISRPRHPEFGHIPVARAPGDDGFAGVCPFHGACLEGMASVTALRARFGEPSDWPADHSGWDAAAHYLAQACRVLFLTTAATRIVLGGGLMTSPHILARVRAAFVAQVGGYVGADAVLANDLIRTPEHGDDAGLVGAAMLGEGVLGEGVLAGRSHF